MSNEKLKKKYDKYIDGIETLSKTPFKVSVGPERFLAPEMFFNPEIVDERYRQPVDELVDKVIQLCPIDTRRQLYSNIALSGGSTLFKGFKERLERRVKERVNDRLRKYEALSKSKVNLMILSQHPSMWKSWTIHIKDTQFGWVGRCFLDRLVSPKCITPERNISRKDLQFADIMLFFRIENDPRLNLYIH